MKVRIYYWNRHNKDNIELEVSELGLVFIIRCFFLDEIKIRVFH